VALLAFAGTSPAQEDAFLRNEKRLTELERQLNLLRQENAALKRRIEILSLPTSEAVEAHLQVRGISGVSTTDEAGRNLSEALERVRLSGSFSARYDFSENRTDLSSASEDTGDHVYTRIELGIHYDLNDNITLGTRLRGSFIGGGIAGLNAPGDPASAADSDTLEIYEAYALFRDVNMFGRLGGHVPVSIQVGRQELLYGDGFILGNDSFGRGISYDGIRFIQESGRHRTDLFWAKLVENDFVTASGAITPTAAPDDDADIAGIHFNYRPVDDTSLAAYALYLKSWGNSASIPFGPYEEASVLTLGARLSGSAMQTLSYAVEAAAQTGKYGGEDVKGAYGVKGAFRYESIGNPQRPYLAFTAVYAAGDNAPADGEFNRFVPLAQDKHGLLGALDLFYASNLKAAGGELGMRPLPELVLSGSYFQYYAVEPADNAGGWLPGGGSGNYIGAEWNVGIGWEISPRSRLALMYGQFHPGDFPVAADTARRLYLAIDVSF